MAAVSASLLHEVFGRVDDQVQRFLHPFALGRGGVGGHAVQALQQDLLHRRRHLTGQEQGVVALDQLRRLRRQRDVAGEADRDLVVLDAVGIADVGIVDLAHQIAFGRRQ
ncbi:hypothetical protein CATMIT_01663, partial [Catenibacterium mitsuokai DSM 15897]